MKKNQPALSFKSTHHISKGSKTLSMLMAKINRESKLHYKMSKSINLKILMKKTIKINNKT